MAEDNGFNSARMLAFALVTIVVDVALTLAITLAGLDIPVELPCAVGPILVLAAIPSFRRMRRGR